MNQGKHGMFHHVDKDFVRTVEFERNDVEQPLLSSNSSFNHKESKSEGNAWDSKRVAFVTVGLLTFLYCVAELAGALYVHSLVLMSDGFHNLSDVISIYIAYWANQAGKRPPSDIATFGWARSEILGGLTNGCFLLSLSLYITLECIPKFIEPVAMESGLLFIVIAVGGLVVNTIGTAVFAATGQSHGHSHSHQGGAHGHGNESHGHGHGHESHGHTSHTSKKRDVNVHAVFLHYLGDMISSVLVLAAGLLIYFFSPRETSWVLYVDPGSSLLIVGIILWTTVPLVKRCSAILLQSTPPQIELDDIRSNLLELEGVIGLHDFHVWQLTDGMIICSLHIGVEEGVDFTKLVNEVKRVLHEAGIHSSAIQPEFVARHESNGICVQNCVVECEEDWCCQKSVSEQSVQEFSSSS